MKRYSLTLIPWTVIKEKEGQENGNQEHKRNWRPGFKQKL